MLLLARLSFVANSLLIAVFTFTLPCLSIASRTRSRTTLPTSSKDRRGDVISVYHHTCQYIILERGVSSDERSFVAYSTPICTKRCSNCNFASASRAILATADCLCSTVRRRHLAQQSSLRPLDALVAAMQSVALQSSDLAALL